MNTETITHPAIAMSAVESSQIAAIGHDSATSIGSSVHFQDRRRQRLSLCQFRCRGIRRIQKR